MANTGITTLIPVVTQALDVVSRELVGLIPSVNRDAKADRLAANQTLYSWAAPTIALQNVTPGAATPTAADRALGNRSISITNFKMADFFFTGEEEAQLNASGAYGGVVADTVEQAVRSLVNGMESDLFLAGAVGASRAFGTAGTTPFASDVSGTAQLGKILDDNGAPRDTRSLVADTTAGAALKTLQQLTRANEAGSTMTLRDGELLNLNKFSVKESAAITTVTAGTMTGALVNNGAGYAIGATSIAYDTGTAGATGIVTGDIITFAGDTNKYVVATGPGAAASGTIVLAAPGLRRPLADNAAITVVATATRNLGFSRNAILLATRLCARPSTGDLARSVAVITDARSGISIELAEYPQYRQVRWEVSAAWGVSVTKPEHLAILLG